MMTREFFRRAFRLTFNIFKKALYDAFTEVFPKTHFAGVILKMVNSELN